MVNKSYRAQTNPTNVRGQTRSKNNGCAKIVAKQKILAPFFKWLFLPFILQRNSRRKGVPANDNTAHFALPNNRTIFLHGRGEYKYQSARTSQYQSALEEIASRKSRHECIANLILDDGNSNDRNCVTVAIGDTVTGIFPRTLSTQYREWLKRWHLSDSAVKCKAVIVAGQDRRKGGKADYRVKLDIEVPFRMTVE